MGRQKVPEMGRVTETLAYRKQHQGQTDLLGLQQASQKHQQPQALVAHCGPLGGQEHGAYPSYLSMVSGSVAKTIQQQTQEQESEETERVSPEGLQRSRKAVLPSEVHHRERSTEDPWRGRLEEEQEMTRIPSLSQAMEAKDHDRRRHRVRERDRPIFIHKGVEDIHNQPGAAQAEPAISAFNTDTGDLLSSQRTLQNQAHDFTEDQAESRVSVAQLRHSYLENRTTAQASRRNEL